MSLLALLAQTSPSPTATPAAGGGFSPIGVLIALALVALAVLYRNRVLGPTMERMEEDQRRRFERPEDEA